MNENNVKIAIIDNGIDENFLNNPLEYKIFITEEGAYVPDEDSTGQINFLHGTTCAMLIEKYFPECILSSVKVLDSDGTGLLTKLKPALEWCLLHQIKVVNISFGSTHFKDKEQIRALVNYYSAKGLVMVAATANSGYVSYPASLSNVIGVAAVGDEYNDFAGNRYLGIDVLAPVESALVIKGEKIHIQKSNSYAAPYVTVLAGKLCSENPSLHVSEVKRALQLTAKEHDIYFLDGYDVPDWIHTAFIRTAGKKSCAEYYFNAADEGAVQESNPIDTVIVEKLSAIKKDECHDKNIVCLRNEIAEQAATGRFFWNPQKRLKQIIGTEHVQKETGYDVPLIVCEWDHDVDEMFLLTELKKSFYREGYHLYAFSFQVESVLYGLEYIPVEVLEKEYRPSFNGFMNRQAYYNQNDAVLFGLHSKFLPKAAQLLEQTDLRIVLEQENSNYKISFLCGGIVVEHILLEQIDFESIKLIFQKIIKILGDIDE